VQHVQRNPVIQRWSVRIAGGEDLPVPTCRRLRRPYVFVSDYPSAVPTARGLEGSTAMGVDVPYHESVCLAEFKIFDSCERGQHTGEGDWPPHVQIGTKGPA
jgi:hypothetical protein